MVESEELAKLYALFDQLSQENQNLIIHEAEELVAKQEKTVLQLCEDEAEK